MAEAKQTEAWNHTASLIAWLVKVNSSKKTTIVDPIKFHPFLKDQRRKQSKAATIARLNEMVGIG
jgi:hypothetical protein